MAENEYFLVHFPKEDDEGSFCLQFKSCAIKINRSKLEGFTGEELFITTEDCMPESYRKSRIEEDFSYGHTLGCVETVLDENEKEEKLIVLFPKNFRSFGKKHPAKLHKEIVRVLAHEIAHVKQPEKKSPFLVRFIARWASPLIGLDNWLSRRRLLWHITLFILLFPITCFIVPIARIGALVSYLLNPKEIEARRFAREAIKQRGWLDCVTIVARQTESDGAP